MAKAAAVREKEKAAFDKESTESKTNLAALKKADDDRQTVVAFLSGGEADAYSPASGGIVGILKQLGDEMQKDQDDTIATEEAAVKTYEELVAAKKKEISALSKAIEEKMDRIGRVGVEIAEMENDLSDTTETHGEDKKFLADLKKNCDSKAAVHEEEKKMRAQEIVALADTIKILNDDDALDLFKKTLPSAGASFVQLQTTASAMRARARAFLAQARSRPGQDRQRIDFVTLALNGRKVGFDKVIKLIHELVVTLKKEQDDDDHKKEYCTAQFDEAEDKKKELERTISHLGAGIEEAKEGIQTLGDEISALKAGIVALDKAVAEATEQRKAENAEYKELMASNGAAKEIILFAKNRLNKFYNPKMYKAPPKKAEEAASFVQLASSASVAGAPPPPPETAEAYTKKSEESGGVLAMMDLLVKDLEKEMTEAETEEKLSQEDYEKTMADSAEKRALDSKALTDKEASKADLEGELETSHAEKKSTAKELMATDKYISGLHAECDWLLQYFDVRMKARTDEIDALKKAKAVLSGADYALLQRGSVARSRKFLRHA